MITGRPEKAREIINKAISLDPLSFTIRNHSTILYITQKQFDKALEENLFCLELIKDHSFALDRQFIIYLGLGNEKAAAENLMKVGLLRGEYTKEQADSAYLTNGINGLLRLKAKTYGWIAGRAYCYVLLKDYDNAIKSLESALNQNKLTAYELNHIDTEQLESNPRFKVIKKAVGLENY